MTPKWPGRTNGRAHNDVVKSRGEKSEHRFDDSRLKNALAFNGRPYTTRRMEQFPHLETAKFVTLGRRVRKKSEKLKSDLAENLLEVCTVHWQGGEN